jgi:biotin carboxylase
MPWVEANRQGVTKLLVLGAGRQQLGLLHAARKRGLVVVAVDRDPSAPGFRLADRRALISFEDEPALHRLAEAERIDGVISPANDWSVGIAARIAHRLAMSHPLDPKTAALAASWLKQRERFAETGVPHDAWLGDGPEVTVQAFSLGGELHALSGPGEAAAVAAQAAGALGIREGPTSTRIRISARGPQVIELAARLGSPEEVEVVRVATGVDLNELALKGALGEAIDLDELVRRPQAA